ncbi:alpha/beta fold hydrolase [Marinobacter salicampi]|uniref:alpha/beta fold hydrolase n=1 Tax=Marinobacter salicampi TaxID=435907 RepID=UPI0014092299|nr:alpha/beta hydrolase [Marinobacter salicampi]
MRIEGTTSPQSPERASGNSHEKAAQCRYNCYLDLPDGRRLAYADCGDPEGRPVIFSHGMPGSRMEAGFFHEQGLAAGFRIIAVDRPGIGFSTRQKRRTLLDYASDVAVLTDQLDLRKFIAMGWSSGGSRSLACAFALPGQVERVVLLSSYTHLEEYPTAGRWFLTTGWPGPAVLAFGMPVFRFAVACMARLARMRSGAYMTQVRKLTSPADRALLQDPGHWRLFHRDQLVCLHSHGRAIAQDLANELSGWGFSLADVRVPVAIYQGTDDPFTPEGFGQHLARHLPWATLERLPGQGHFYFLDKAFQASLFQQLSKTSADDSDEDTGND